MRIGIALSTGIPGTDPDLTLRWARRAEELGFSHLAAIDRIAYGNDEPLVMLAAAAAVTRRIRLAMTVLIAPLRTTAVLAKQVVSLDRVSRGRLVLGERACAYVIPRPGTPPTLAELARFLSEDKHIARFKLPERLELRERLPMTAVGKISKKDLREEIAATLTKERS